MTALIKEELSDNELPEKSKRATIVERLNERRLLDYGAVIAKSDIEYIMDIKQKMLSETEWAFACLQLREIIKREGFFVTSRGRQNDIYLLEQHEMASYNENKNKIAYNNLKQRQRSLHMINVDVLNSEQQKKLEFEILRNASLEIEMHKKLKSRCRY